MQGEEIKAAQAAFSLPDPRELNPLQLAYVGDTLHDLYVRSLLISKKMRLRDTIPMSPFIFAAAVLYDIFS